MSSAGVLRLDDAIQKRMTRGPDERIEYFGKVRDRLASTVLMLRERKGNMAPDMTDAERERNRVCDALAEMTALHKALPAEVRGRVLFQPNEVLDQDTERGQVNALIRFVDQIDEAIERSVCEHHIIRIARRCVLLQIEFSSSLLQFYDL